MGLIILDSARIVKFGRKSSEFLLVKFALAGVLDIIIVVIIIII